MSDKFPITYIAFSKNKQDLVAWNSNISRLLWNLWCVTPQTPLRAVRVHANAREFKLHALLLLVGRNSIQ